MEEQGDAVLAEVKLEEIETKLEDKDVLSDGQGTKRKRNSLTDKEKELLQRVAKLAVPKRVNPKKRNWSQEHGKDRVIDHLKTYTKRKLRAELAALVGEHRWEQAAAVVSVLIGAHSGQDDMELLSVADCWAAMEVLRRVEDDEGDEEDACAFIKRLFRMLLRKKQLSPKLRAAVQLELGLYLMSQNDYDGCYNELRALVDVPPYRDDPLLNFWFGLNLHHSWYEKASEDVKKYAVLTPQEPVDGRASLHFEGTGETAGIDHQHPLDYGVHDYGVQVEGTPTLATAGHTFGENTVQDVKPVRISAYDSRPQGRLYNDEDLAGEETKEDDSWTSAVILWSSRLDRRLLPVCLPRRLDNPYYYVPLESSTVREAHSGAVKHLQQALSLDPCLTEALLPLIQLLLAVGNVNDTMLQINKCCQAAPDHVVPFSLKALVLEELVPKHNLELARTYKTLVNINPSSTSSLEALIALHSSGYFDTLSLMEAIATHLDVEAGTVLCWDKLAACFKAVAKHVQKGCEESLRTVGLEYSGANEVKPEILQVAPPKVKEEPDEAVPNEISNANILSRVEEIWVDRRRWWERKHFCTNTAPMANQHGALEVVLWKAICAAHILGSGRAYEQRVRETFEKGERVLLLRRLKKHVTTPVYSLVHNHDGSSRPLSR